MSPIEFKPDFKERDPRDHELMALNSCALSHHHGCLGDLVIVERQKFGLHWGIHSLTHLLKWQLGEKLTTTVFFLMQSLREF